MVKRSSKWIGTAAMSLALSVPIVAQAVEYSLSGFGTVTAGKVVDSETIKYGNYDVFVPYTQKYGIKCPCYEAAPVSGGTYDSTLAVGEESRLGLQGTVEFDEKLSLTGQAVARKTLGAPGVKLEWAYLTYKPNSKFTLQVGKKRLPLFYYSDFQDVTFALPWARVPSEAYRWPINNYYGVSGQYQTSLPMDVDLKVSAYAGQEDENQPVAPILQQANPNYYVRARDMNGLSFEFTRDWLSYKLSANQNRASSNGAAPIKQGFYSWALNVDYKGVVVRGESAKYLKYNKNGDEKMAVLGVGYAVTENIIPMYTYTSRKNYTDVSKGKPRVSYDYVVRAYGVRYNVSSSASIKLQYESKRQREIAAGYAITSAGRVDLASVTYDFVF